jgi:hypothetical protein
VYDAGQRVFGENYVQELLEKAPMLPADVQWHFIGHLQSNKAKSIVAIPTLVMVETVDRFKIAAALNAACESEGRDRLDVLVEASAPQRLFSGGLGSDRPVASSLQLFERTREVGDARDLRVRGRASRRLRDDARDGRRAIFRDDDAIGTERVRGADDRAEVHRILNAIEHDDQARATVHLRRSEDLLERRVVELPHLGDDALVNRLRSHAIETNPIDPIDPNAVRARAAEDLAGDRLLEALLLNAQPIDLPGLAAQQLEHRVDAVDVAIVTVRAGAVGGLIATRGLRAT